MQLHPLEQTPEQWAAWVQEGGGEAYRGKQVFAWMHARGVVDAGQMTDLPGSLRLRLARLPLSMPLQVGRVLRSLDGTRKLLLQTAEGGAIECVLLRSADGSVTQCVSSQVGCAMGCVFCASGQEGWKRHLSAAEIVAQVLVARQLLASSQERLGRIVFMGMGEPLHNYEAVAQAIRLLIHPRGVALPPGRITVSTSGLVPQIEQLGRDFGGAVQLALSLHATEDAQRSALVPINRKYPLQELMAAVRNYPRRPRDVITVQYTLIAGRNDSPADAQRLLRLLRGLPVKVNLIPMNPIEASELAAPAADVVGKFQAALRHGGLPAFIRRTLGDDVDAACGQLALRRASSAST